MVVAVLALVFFAVILVMATLGAVLVARFLMGGAPPSRRVFAAALGGPLSLILPLWVIGSAGDGDFSTEQLVGFTALLLIAFGAVGWPIAHLATRRLDRLTRFDPQVFE